MSEASAVFAESPVEHRHVIAIDGPAAAGKSTVARLLADRLGAMLFDTGVLYRVVALIARRTGIEPSDAAALARIARDARIRVTPPSELDGRLYDVRLDGEDVTWEIREPEIGAIVSPVAEHQMVRSALLPLQRAIASSGPVVMVGRDIGTVVVPDAGLKVYLDATPEERARRRYREALARGGTETFADVLAETGARDAIDSGRDAAPLREAADAVHMDTDGKPIDAVVAAIEALARTQRLPNGAPVWPS
jgi:cytidylate kinase